jgi:hypothetical protein
MNTINAMMARTIRMVISMTAVCPGAMHFTQFVTVRHGRLAPISNSRVARRSFPAVAGDFRVAVRTA